jgi:choline dehydrogenase-like flavoprotein
MELDGRALAHGHVLETDICIVGAGPAGMVLACELIGNGAQVALIESGGLEPNASVQELNDAITIGHPYMNPKLMRNRQAAGTVHMWNTPVGTETGAKYVPLDPIDFEERTWMPLSGWPFAQSHLKPFYRRAQDICALGPFEYGSESWTDPQHPVLPLTSTYLTTKIYQFGLAKVFTERCLNSIRASSNVTLCYYLNVTSFVTDAAAERVIAAQAKSLTGKEILVRAKIFVGAAGAIENARLLLLSNQHSVEGLGNRYGWVGRCFMEHPRDYSLTLLPTRAQLFEEAVFYDVHPAPSGTTVMGRLALRREAILSERLMNASATLLPISKGRIGSLAGRLHLKGLRRWVSRRSYPRGGSGWSLVRQKDRVFDGFRLLLNLEQAPDPQNRVVLDVATDFLGVRKAKVHWSWSKQDQTNLERIRKLLATELGRSKIGHVEIARGLRPDPHAHHHAGTTRMHSDPQLGVTDSHGRVHGLENLYMAGSSLFPTAGFANPTLSIVAMSLRLADHLKSPLA